MSLDIKSPVIFYAFILYLFSLIIEGLIRYALHKLGAEPIIYVKDLFILFIILIYAAKVLISGKVNKLILVVIFLIFFHTIIGLLYTRNIYQVLFGLKIMVPIIMGMLIYPAFSSRPEITTRIFLIFLIIAIMGVFLNMFVTFPWEGLSYSLGGQEIEGTRDWEQYGVKRIAGFARSYAEVSIQILILVIYLISYLKRRLIAISLWLLAGIAIMLTLQKGIIVTYIVLSLLLVIYKTVPNIHKIYQKVLIVPIMNTILLPIIGYIYSNQLGNVHFLKNYVLLTFRDRLVNAWPDNIEFIKRQGDLILGRGIGGIGMSQKIFEIQQYAPGDNLFVYAWAFFGILSVIYFLCIYKLAQNIEFDKEGFFYYFILWALFLFGIVTSVFESPFFTIFLGLCLKFLWNKAYEKKEDYSLLKLESA